MKSLIQAGLVAIACLWTSATFADGVGGSSSSVGTGFPASTAEATATDDGVHLKVTGDAARTIYDGLDVDERGPFSTGLCVPGLPCDPPTFWGKTGTSVQCSKTSYSVSGRVEYSCQLTVTADGRAAELN
jgi:hypothetical protein